MLKTDLVMETCEILKESDFDISKFAGVLSEEYVDNTCIVTKITILNDEGSKKIGKPIGEYYTIDICDKLPNNVIFCLKNILKQLLPVNKKVLVAGIGNKDITPDAIGPAVVDNTVVTRHLLENPYFAHMNEVCAIATNVLARTGIETGDILKNICKDINPNIVIAIDALAAKNPTRLGNVLQVSNTGLTPGSGINNSRASIDHNNLGVNVIAIGVPTVITGSTLAYSINKQADISLYEDIIVTPKEIDTIIKKTSKIIAYALNYAINPSLNEDDMHVFLE